jgi:phenolic acid decarboxylase
MLTSILGTTKLALRQRLGLRTCHRRARHRRLPPLKEGPHAGRHAIQHFYYQRVAPGVETTVWYEESGALVHITWYLETQTVHRFAALPAWLAEDMTVYRGDNQDPAFIEKIRMIISQRQDFPRHILNDDGYFKVI